MSLSSSAEPIFSPDLLPTDSNNTPAPPTPAPTDPTAPDPRCDFHPHSTNQKYTYQRPRDGFYKRLIVACDGTWQRAGYLDSKETSILRGTTDVFPSNVARLGWLVDTSCPDWEYGGAEVAVGAEMKVKVGVKVRVKVSEGEVTTEEGAEVTAEEVAEVVEGETAGAEIPRAVQQVVYYQAGVGSRGTWLPRTLDAAFGRGLESNVREAYAFLVNNYEPPDEIFIFGFSRGAYTARSLAGFVNKFGILFKSEMEHFSEIWARYKNRKSTAEWEEWLWKEGHKIRRHMNVPIKIVGVWDTVGSLGVPGGWLGAREWNRRFGFWDTGLNYGIENAFHALALDEHRSVMTPTMWSLVDEPPPGTPRCPVPPPSSTYPDQPFLRPPKNPTTPTPPCIKRDPARLRAIAINTAKRPTLLQCWFPGVHIDIGGGHDKVWDRKKGHIDLSLYSEYCNLTLLWMIDQCKDFLVFRPEGIRRLQAEIVARARLVDPAATGLDWASANVTNSYTITEITSWAGSKVRCPGDYVGLKRKKGLNEKLPVPLPLPLPITPETEVIEGETYEVVHPTARIRSDVGKMPLALKQHKAVWNEEGRKWAYTILGKPEKWYLPPWLGGKRKEGLSVEIGEYDGAQGRKDGEGWTSVEKVAWGSEEEWVRCVGERRRWEWACGCLGVGEGVSGCVCGRWEIERRRREDCGQDGEVHVNMVRGGREELEEEAIQAAVDG
ncbi:hypothetical protein L211DRAFT_831976 [Terfezia boudieri ATCC MYA-4762]|uniref:T6SS Phospholipase effector Tle1-like catalytic domain-containing protein n=1 Tax=Terfezia boudieri ATCC MYA-4762 TaxID=1051890 RepID=A0A3N4M6F0_9PEZI|nr:hypothetical protein L211DRAFT_831976 [Terfezia boudieri ATCC MYA-4762]